MDKERRLSWERLREHRLVAAVLLVLLAAVVLWLPFQAGLASYPAVLRLVHLGFPSVAVFGAFVLVSWPRSVTGGMASAVGGAVYLVVGVVLARAGAAHVGSAWPGGLFIWPTLLLMQWGRSLGWVPLPE